LCVSTKSIQIFEKNVPLGTEDYIMEIMEIIAYNKKLTNQYKIMVIFGRRILSQNIALITHFFAISFAISFPFLAMNGDLIKKVLELAKRVAQAAINDENEKDEDNEDPGVPAPRVPAPRVPAPPETETKTPERMPDKRSPDRGSEGPNKRQK